MRNRFAILLYYYLYTMYIDNYISGEEWRKEEKEEKEVLYYGKPL